MIAALEGLRSHSLLWNKLFFYIRLDGCVGNEKPLRFLSCSSWGRLEPAACTAVHVAAELCLYVNESVGKLFVWLREIRRAPGHAWILQECHGAMKHATSSQPSPAPGQSVPFCSGTGFAIVSLSFLPAPPRPKK